MRQKLRKNSDYSALPCRYVPQLNEGLPRVFRAHQPQRRSSGQRGDPGGGGQSAVGAHRADLSPPRGAHALHEADEDHGGGGDDVEAGGGGGAHSRREIPGPSNMIESC